MPATVRIKKGGHLGECLSYFGDIGAGQNPCVVSSPLHLLAEEKRDQGEEPIKPRDSRLLLRYGADVMAVAGSSGAARDTSPV